MTYRKLKIYDDEPKRKKDIKPSVTAFFGTPEILKASPLFRTTDGRATFLLDVLDKIYQWTKNEKGYCWATNEDFAKKLNVSEQTITNSLTRLEKDGVIRIKYPQSPARQIFVNPTFKIIYTLAFEKDRKKLTADDWKMIDDAISTYKLVYDLTPPTYKPAYKLLINRLMTIRDVRENVTYLKENVEKTTGFFKNSSQEGKGKPRLSREKKDIVDSLKEYYQRYLDKNEQPLDREFTEKEESQFRSAATKVKEFIDNSTMLDDVSGSDFTFVIRYFFHACEWYRKVRGFKDLLGPGNLCGTLWWYYAFPRYLIKFEKIEGWLPDKEWYLEKGHDPWKED